MKIICIKLDLSIIVSASFSNKFMLKDRNYRTHNTEILNLDENKFVYKKNYLWRNRFSEILKSEVCTKWEKWIELKNYELTNSQCKIWEKIMKQYKSSLRSCRQCKLWMIQENFKKWNQIMVGDCLTFPVNQRWFQVLVPCWAVTNACHVEYIGIFGERFW